MLYSVINAAVDTFKSNGINADVNKVDNETVSIVFKKATVQVQKLAFSLLYDKSENRYDLVISLSDGECMVGLPNIDPLDVVDEVENYIFRVMRSTMKLLVTI